MMPTALKIIKAEHLSIAAVVYSLRYLVRQIRDHGAKPDFRLFYAILDYIVEYPDRFHHPKEDDYLFKILRERNTDARPIIAELEAEHITCAQLSDDLQSKLLRYEQEEEIGFGAFAQAVEEYAEINSQCTKCRR